MPDNNADSPEDDCSMSLREIAAALPNKSLISRLVELDDEEFRVAQEKRLEFIEDLECLYFGLPKRSRDDDDGAKRSTTLRRGTVNGFDGDFVAVSYTWNASPAFERGSLTGGYLVEERGSNEVKPSPVRNSVFDRLGEYMEYLGYQKDKIGGKRRKRVKYFWIDQHCIEQERGAEKEVGMQAMDRVYGYSKYPVALLARPIKSFAERDLLACILDGSFVTSNLKLSSKASSQRRLQALELLKEITDDLWWTRGWTFQENYRSLPKMKLLVPHTLALGNPKKLSANTSQGLSVLRGQFCISSWMFHEEATKFCLAYESQRRISKSLRDMCESVRTRAGKYTILLREMDEDGEIVAPKSMTPTVFKDITDRDLGWVWDRIPIAANCCQYSIRLDSLSLMKNEPSVSVAMLALYLLNGEIMWNDRGDAVDIEEIRNEDVAGFIDYLAYDDFRAPRLRSHLTFNKGCRFADVELTQEGIETNGYLWVVDRILPAETFRSVDHPKRRSSRGDFDEHGRRRLGELVDRLFDIRELPIAYRLKRFLNRDFHAGPKKTFSKHWLYLMAKNIVQAMDDGKDLGIGHLIENGTPDSNDRGAVFILENFQEVDGSSRETTGSSSYSDSSSDDGDDSDDIDDCDGTDASDVRDLDPREHIHVFTSFRPEESSWQGEDLNDLDRHVSMVVRCENVHKRCPKLFTNRWIHGICFFEGQSPQGVLFPWPEPFVGL